MEQITGKDRDIILNLYFKHFKSYEEIEKHFIFKYKYSQIKKTILDFYRDYDGNCLVKDTKRFEQKLK